MKAGASVTELDDMKSLRDTLVATIRRSSDLAASGRSEPFLTLRERAERDALLARMEATILKIEGQA